MVKLLWLFVLFSFQHGISYNVNYVHCDIDEIEVRYEDEVINVELFNIEIKEETGWKQTCHRLQEAENLRIEVDPSSKLDDRLPVYLFYDDELLQESLLREDLAYIKIKNPEYTYAKQMEAASQKHTSVVAQEKKRENEEGAIVAPLYLLAIFGLWCLLLLYLLRCKYKQKSIRKS